MKFQAKILFLTSLIYSKVTPDEKKKLVNDMNQADKELHFLNQTTIYPTIKSTSPLLVMFGAKWCINTMRMTPVFLNVMKDLEKDPKLKSLHFELFKMECTPKETQNFCTHEFNLDGFPTLYLYHQGKRVDEYLDGPDESKLLDWIKVSATKYPHIDTSNMVMQSSPTQATPQQIQNALHQKIQTANQMQQPPTPGTTSTVQGKVAGAHEDCDNPLDDTQPLTPTQQQKSSNPSSTPHPVPTDKVSFNKALIGYMVLFVSIILVVWILRLVQRRKRRTQMAYYRLGGYPASKQLEKDLDD